MRTWEDKVNEVIAQLSRAAWHAANTDRQGKPYKKHHAYRIPEEATELVKCLGMHNRRTAEIRAKEIMEGLRLAGVPIDNEATSSKTKLNPHRKSQHKAKSASRQDRTATDVFAESVHGAVARHGEYTDLVLTSSALYIFPTAEGQDAAKEMLDRGGRASQYEALRSMIEDHLANGWEEVDPETVGAMTDGYIISDEVLHDSKGEVVLVGRAYWFADYAITDELGNFAHGRPIMLTREGKLLSQESIRQHSQLLEAEEAGDTVDWSAFGRRFSH